MKNKKLFEKAYSRLTELYASDYTTPDIIVLSRFYREKMILSESALYMRYLDFLGKVRVKAKQKGEHIFVRGTTGSSFIAYLLGATDINPLPGYEYCPKCHSVNFTGNEVPLDKPHTKCSCGTEIEVDGYNIPFEYYLKSVLSEYFQLSVSYAFFDEVKAMIYDEMWDKSIVTLKNDDRSITWFCILDKETNEPGEYTLNGNSEIFANYPRITLVPDSKLDRYRELEKATGFKMKNIGTDDLSFIYFQLMDGNTQGIPFFDSKFMRDIKEAVKLQSYDDLLKVIGFAYSTNVWKDNAENLYEEHRMSLREIPAYREELYDMICDRLNSKGIYDNGLAYEIMEKAWRGYYAKAGEVDEDTALSLLQIDFDMDFIFFLEKINYMFPKAHGVAYLREAIAMMYYKLKYNKEYNEVTSAFKSFSVSTNYDR